MNRVQVRFQTANDEATAIFFDEDSGWSHYVTCEEGELIAFFHSCRVWTIAFLSPLNGRERELSQIVLHAYEKACAAIDLGEPLMHPAIMREKVEAIQRESFRERDRASTTFLRRRLGLEDGDAVDALARYYEHEFRLQRAKDIEDALVANRVDEASLDLRTIGQDALTWAGWMIAARLFPASEAQ